MILAEQVARDAVLRLMRKRRVPQANFHSHVIAACSPIQVTKEQAVEAISSLVREGQVVAGDHYFRLP